MQRHFRNGLASALIAAMALLAPPASGQIIDSIDQQLLEPWRGTPGNIIRFCIFSNSTTYDFDRAVSEEIAARLLVGSRFVDLGDRYGIGSEFIGEDIFIALVNDCDALMGINLFPDGFPPEFTVTRPYASFDYVLVTNDDAITTLEDVPRDRRIGTPLASYGDYLLAAHARARPQAQAWLRLPYGDMDLMATRLLDGTLGAMIMFSPSHKALLERNPALADDLVVLPLDVDLQTGVNRGGLMLQRSAYLRAEMDRAITEMVADGTIAALLAETGFGDAAGRPGGF